MSNLREIRRRLRSTENIKKITDAMERVAAARLRRAQMVAEESRPYATKMKEILIRLASCSDINNPLFQGRPVKKTALIVVAADKGLSGSYNSNILSAADNFIKKYSKDNLELLLFGKKAIEYYRKSEFPKAHEHNGWTGKITLKEIKDFSNQLIADYLSEKYDEVWIIYTHFISVGRRDVKVEKFLNIEKPKEEKAQSTEPNYIFEPSPAKIVAELLPRYCVARLQEAFQDAYASELSSRIMAMQMASKNSQTLIDSLTLTRNKVRQESITNEMIEIVSGGMSSQ